MTDMRLYAPTDCGVDGYPPEWHETVKHAVRDAAGNRCVRCMHPYVKGAGEWSPCDEQCAHRGPYRYEWNGIWEDVGADGFVNTAGTVKRSCGLRAVEARWRILTVHHLNGYKFDCRWWNLASLCQRCHLQVQGKVLMPRVWPWPHSEWFKPYAAGYYAWAYLGEELSREETLARMDELLGLELAA